MAKKISNVEIYDDYFNVITVDDIKVFSKEYFINFINNTTGDYKFKHFNISKGDYYKILNKWNCYTRDPNFTFDVDGMIVCGVYHSKNEFIDYYKVHSQKETLKYFKIGWRRFLKLVDLWEIEKTHDDILNTIHQTNLKNHGVEVWNNMPKMYETLKENYGSLDNAYACMYKKGCDTKMSRYGDPNYRNTEKIFDTINKKYGMHYFKTKEFIEKAHTSKINNNSYGRSRPEEILFILLKEKYGEDNVIPQYSDERYPFNCDFYVKSEDKFIELNSFWTHYTEEYDPNNTKHKEVVELWKERSLHSDLYKSALYTWTESDPLKIKTAKENNLNYEILRYKIIKNEIIFSNGLKYDYKKYYEEDLERKKKEEEN